MAVKARDLCEKDSIVQCCQREIIRDPNLLLDGLYLIYQKNVKKS